MACIPGQEVPGSVSRGDTSAAEGAAAAAAAGGAGGLGCRAVWTVV